MNDALALSDIETTDDIRTVVHAFYDGMEADPVIGTYFAGLDWAEHLPKMVRFWSSVVFHTGVYRGRPFEPHARMPALAPEHFSHWVARFHRTIDARFAGERAEFMKGRAEQVATIFQMKLGLWGMVPDARAPR